MKLITAVITPTKLEPVREALSAIAVTGLTVSEARGFGRQKGHREVYRGAEYEVQFTAKIKIELAVADDHVDQVVEVIAKSANTGRIGAGKIFVQPLEQVVRIRTGEHGDTAL